MPRSPRIDAPGLLQHVIARGVNRCQIFADDQDRFFFLEKLGGIFLDTNTTCYSWVLMPNHFHLLIRAGGHPLGNTMKRLLGSYATYFNLRHRRTGHLFQNRYKSIVVEEDGYLATLVAYIHLNPYRAKIVQDLNKLNAYSWSGHLPLIGKAGYPWQDTNFVLDFLGGRKAYLDYLLSTAGREQPDLDGGGLYRSLGLTAGQEIPKAESGSFDTRILGSADFALDILDRFENTGMKLGRPALSVLMEAVCNQLVVNKEELTGRSKTKNLSAARGICAALAKTFGYSGAQIAGWLNITEGAVVKAVARGIRDRDTLVKLSDSLVSKGS